MPPHVRVGLVGFKDGEFRVVAGVDALVAKGPADLIDALEAADQETLQKEFGAMRM
jgi:hypothetical protein